MGTFVKDIKTFDITLPTVFLRHSKVANGEIKHQF